MHAVEPERQVMPESPGVELEGERTVTSDMSSATLKPPSLAAGLQGSALSPAASPRAKICRARSSSPLACASAALRFCS